MIIENLTVTDFRVFSGKKSFDLKPQIVDGRKKPIILFAGLNGAGKTTTLTAIRLALYGRLSLGINTTQKAYEEYLASCIHSNSDKKANPKSASVELTFSYAHLGQISTYRIDRSWKKNDNKVKEALSIYENDIELRELNYDQCQAFLNELIPIGVSDLFFFDGEKIAELADDDAGKSLGYSIKKLMGLDLIEILRSDLLIWLNNQRKTGESKETEKLMSELQESLSLAEKSAREELDQYEQLGASIAEVKHSISRLEAELASKGGAWAVTRDAEIRKESELSAQKRLLDQQIRELVSDSFPFSLAKDYLNKVIDKLELEQQIKNKQIISQSIETKLASINTVLRTYFDNEKSLQVSSEIRDKILENDGRRDISISEIKHDISQSTFERIRLTAESSVRAEKELANINEQVREISREIDNAGANIARAPDEHSLAADLQAINDKHSQKTKLITQQRLHSERYRTYLRAALDTARQLDKLSDSHIVANENKRITNVVHSIRALLSEFAREIAKQKVKDLEKEFISSFRRLARKDDMQLFAKIDPETFAVTLVDNSGTSINKNALSAGEKQIYAISILEALAKTSGRHLPIIVDTPLGRLDSHHRTNIVRNYFPNASHQVVILSTDTEIDENYYDQLEEYVSHSYRLEYTPESMGTSVVKGYFWKDNLESLV